MQKTFITTILIFLIIASNAMCADLNASDVDMSNVIIDMSIVVGAVFSFLTFIYGSKRVLKFLG